MAFVHSRNAGTAVLLRVICIVISFVHALGTPPYTLAGPLKPSPHHVTPGGVPPAPAPPGRPAGGPPTKGELEPGGMPGESYDAQQAADIAAGLRPPPEAMKPLPAVHPTFPPGAWPVVSPGAAAGLTPESAAMHALVASPVASLICAGCCAVICIPAAWLCFTARAALMRNWFAAVTISYAVFVVVLRVCLVLINMPPAASMILALAIAGPSGWYLFGRPTQAWPVIFVWSVFVLTQLLRLTRGGGSWTLALLVFIFLAFTEAVWGDMLQGFVTAAVSAWVCISSLSYILSWLGVQPGSPFDPTSFWASSLPAVVSIWPLLHAWLALTLAGMAVQLLRTRQGLTVQFEPLFGGVRKR